MSEATKIAAHHAVIPYRLCARSSLSQAFEGANDGHITVWHGRGRQESEETPLSRAMVMASERHPLVRRQEIIALCARKEAGAGA